MYVKFVENYRREFLFCECFVLFIHVLCVRVTRQNVYVCVPFFVAVLYLFLTRTLARVHTSTSSYERNTREDKTRDTYKHSSIYIRVDVYIHKFGRGTDLRPSQKCRTREETVRNDKAHTHIHAHNDPKKQKEGRKEELLRILRDVRITQR